MATYTYGYSVTVYSDYQDYFQSGDRGSLSFNQWYQFTDRSKTDADDFYVPSKEESLSTTAKKLTFKKGMNIVYYMRFYMKKVDGAQTDYFWLDDAAVKNIKINLQSSAKLSGTSVATIKSTSAANQTQGEVFDEGVINNGWIRSRLFSNSTGNPKLYGVTSGHCFIVEMEANAAGTLSKGFTIDAEITPSNYTYGQGATFQVTDPSATKVIITNDVISSTLNNGTSALLGIKPSITITEAEVEPPVNPNFKTALLAQTEANKFVFVNRNDYDRYKGVNTFHYVYGYNSCATDPAKAWVGVKWGLSYDKNDVNKGMVRFAKIYGSKDGQNLTVVGPTDNPISTRKTTVTNGMITSDNLEEAIREVIAARKGNCKSISSEDKGNEDDNGAKNETVIAAPVAPADSKRWNPPPHADARGVDYFTKINTGQFFSARGQALDPSEFRNIVNTYIGTRPERGRIFQDKITAKIMNNTSLSVKTKPAEVLQWGFRFMYNPEMISYESADSGVDWTYGSQDVSVNLSGNQTVSFDLLINRIPDMSYLKLMTGPFPGATVANSTPAIKSVYGRDLEDYEKEGILKRGTEYDIEYLYRVLTGDPAKNSLLFEPGYGAKALTSDIGYTTKVPVWLFLHENLRYYGSVNSISVTHRIFDQNMVPMLSRVGISFSRYPALEGNTPKTKTTGESTGKD
jgi:hypothetical protein